MSKGNGVDIEKMPQRFSLYLELDKLKKKIENSKGMYSEISKKISFLVGEMNLGEDNDIIKKTNELVDCMEKLGIFPMNIVEIQSALERVKTI
ncbi:hypothetical protein GQ568_01805 [Patescibacteria group bacterium]|nr:hypothetical protein [Patescibacteria group bacterium]